FGVLLIYCGVLLCTLSNTQESRCIAPEHRLGSVNIPPSLLQTRCCCFLSTLQKVSCQRRLVQRPPESEKSEDFFCFYSFYR
uniref:Uncharacterized protein n=1 Tax=Acanthochromis polyacanthus TaxID=80966 RepID=A0A3Q1F9G4_9TELE